jgi:hypothetical protein
MTNEETGNMLNAIGKHVANIIGKIPEDVYVFIEAGDQWQGGAVFENLEDRVICHPPSDELIDEIGLLWEAAEPDKKWSIIHYDIKGGVFNAKFLYTADLEHHPFEYHYRGDALDARYGDKPVIYPPMDDGDWHQLTEDDLPDDESPST